MAESMDPDRNDPLGPPSGPAPAALKSPAPMPRAAHTPAGAGTLGMWLFLATLTMLFASSVLLYLIFRLVLWDAAPPVIDFDRPWVPALFVVSTVTILLSSFTLHQALAAVRRERQGRLRAMLVATLALAGTFIVVQTPAMVALVRQHFAFMADSPEGNPGLFGLVFFLVLVHALHVVGGVIPLSVVAWKAHRGAYDHEQYGPVRYTTMYWHFLDGVWIVMFLMFLVVG